MQALLTAAYCTNQTKIICCAVTCQTLYKSGGRGMTNARQFLSNKTLHNQQYFPQSKHLNLNYLLLASWSSELAEEQENRRLFRVNPAMIVQVLEFFVRWLLLTTPSEPLLGSFTLTSSGMSLQFGFEPLMSFLACFSSPTYDRTYGRTRKRNNVYACANCLRCLVSG